MSMSQQSDTARQKKGSLGITGFPVRGYGKKKHVKTSHLECSGKIYLAVICTQNLLRKGELILKIRLKQV